MKWNVFGFLDRSGNAVELILGSNNGELYEGHDGL